MLGIEHKHSHPVEINDMLMDNWVTDLRFKYLIIPMQKF